MNKKIKIIFITISVIFVIVLISFLTIDLIMRNKEKERKELMPDIAPICEYGDDFADNTIIKLLNAEIDPCTFTIQIIHEGKDIILDINQSYFFMFNYTVDTNKLINVDSNNFNSENTYNFIVAYDSNEPTLNFEIYTDGIIKINGVYKAMNNPLKVKKLLESLQYIASVFYNPADTGAYNFSADYDFKYAQRDGYVVYNNTGKIINYDKLYNFYNNTKNYKINGFITIIYYSIEGDPIIYQYHYQDGVYTLFIDTTRDIFSTGTDRKVHDKTLSESEIQEFYKGILLNNGEIDNEINENLVTMTVKKDTISKNGATFILKSHIKIEHEYIYGDEYKIQYFENEDWIDVKTIRDDYGWNAIAYILKGKETKEIEFDWEWLYGNLSKGKYRLIKSIDYFRKSGDYDEYIVSAEFSIK